MNVLKPAKFIYIAVIFSFFHCKKKDAPALVIVENAPSPVKKYDNYLPLKIGNYWIYERFQIEQHGTTFSLNQFDSSYVEKDTLIRNNTFFKIRRYDFIFNQYRYLTIRDSLHYILDSSGKILFSSEDFSTIFSTYELVNAPGDTMYTGYSKMNDKDLVVITPAGTFTTSNLETTYWFFPAYHKPGINNPRSLNNRYCKNIGLIVETEPFYGSSNYMTERRLIRYHLN